MTSDKSNIPIVDFGPFFKGSSSERLQVGNALVEAMKTVGFVYIINHSIPGNQMDEAFTWSKKFFLLDIQQKEKCKHPEDGAHHRGWSSMSKEKAVDMVLDKAEIEKLRKIPDVKESFDCGNEISKYYNIWPEESDLPEFKQFCQQYFQANAEFSKSVLEAIAIGMGLEAEFLLPYHSENDNQLRMLHYPSTKEEDLRRGNTERIAAHTDFGTITMLSQDECGGLEIEDPFNKGIFIPAPYIKHSLVVNIGDFLMRWSNDELKSTIHRVGAPPIKSDTGFSKQRFSIPYFIGANAEKQIDCLPGTFSNTKPKKYEPINALEYINQRLNATY